MKKAFKLLFGLVIILGLVVIFGIYRYGSNWNLYLFPPSAKDYGLSAITRMENGLYAHTDEWATTKHQAINQLTYAESYEDTYPILENAIKVAGGEHSFMHYPNTLAQHNSDEIDLPSLNIDEDILIISLPALTNPTASDAQKYADTINNALHLDDYSGIVIDLSNNVGGRYGPDGCWNIRFNP